VPLPATRVTVPSRPSYDDDLDVPDFLK
jgi:hypothetical protein